MKLRPLFWIPEVVAYESFDCISRFSKNSLNLNLETRFLIPENIEEWVPSLDCQVQLTFWPVLYMLEVPVYMYMYYSR